MKTLSICIITAVFAFSIVCYMHYSSKLNIKRVVLKGKGNYKIINETNDIRIGKLNNSAYNVVLKFLIKNKAEAASLNDVMYAIGKYRVTSTIKDKNGTILESTTIDNGSNMQSGRTNDCIEWYLIKFNADEKHDYNLNIHFESNENLFDSLPKELYVIEDYDYASLPWWHLLQRVSLVISISLFVLLITLIVLSIQKKKII